MVVVVVVVRLLHTFVAEAYHVNGVVDYAAFDRTVYLWYFLDVIFTSEDWDMAAAMASVLVAVDLNY